MKKKINYTIKEFSPTRRIMEDYYEVAGEFHFVMGLVEIDITDGWKKIREIKEKDNYKVTLTSWIAKCIAKAVSEDKRFNSYRKGRKKLVIFEDVDMSVMVEIPRKDGKKVPYNHCIRNIDNKSVKEINEEILSIQKKKIEETEQLSRDKSAKYTNLYMLIPTFIRRMVMRRMLRNPFYVHKIMGTVGISTLGEVFKNNTGWAVGLRDKTVNVALGGITQRVIETENGFETRNIYSMTFSFDHSIVDGAPCAAFVARVSELIRNAYGIDNIDEK